MKLHMKATAALGAFLVCTIASCSSGESGDPGHDVVIDTGGDASGDAEEPWSWPTCPEMGAGAMSLHQKTASLDALVSKKQLDDNLLRSVRLDDEGNVVSRDHLPSTGLWTAMYLASQSFRYAVTGDPVAVENAAIAVKGLHDLTAVTGLPGLYGRAYQRPDFTYTYDAAGSVHWVESPAPGYEGWWYNDDVSKDTMDGIMFGYAAALEFLDDADILETVKKDATGFVRPFVDAGLQIIDHTGEVTEHGRLYYSAIDDFPGFNALLSMSWVRTALDAGLDDGLGHFYRDCLLRLGDWSDCPVLDAMDIGSYMDAFDEFLYVYRPDCKTSYDNIDMVFQAIFPLLRREDDPGTISRLMDKLHVGIWEPEEPGLAPAVHESTHALYVFMYGALAGPDPDDAVFRKAVNDSVCTLYALEAERFDKDVAAGKQEGVCLNRMGDPNAKDVIPLKERYYDNYVWRLDPYEIPKEHVGVKGLLHSPEDYLLAYWMGRYFGYVSKEM